MNSGGVDAELTVNLELFARVLFHTPEITLAFTGVSKSCPSRVFLTSRWQMCILTLFTKVKFSRKFRIYSIILASFCGTWAYSTDPDLTPQNAASDQGLHRLLTECSIKI